MTGIALSQRNRSQLLEKLLGEQAQRPNIQSGGELAARLAAQLVRQKNIQKLRQQDTDAQTQLIKGKNIDFAKNMKKEEILSELGLEYLAKQSPVRIKCALLSMKALKLGLYSYLAKKLAGSLSLDSLKEDATNLY